MKSRHGWYVLAAVVVLTMTGCTLRPRVETREPPTAAAERMAILEERARQWEMYQGVLRISAHGPTGTVRRVRTMVLAAQPHRLRMEALNPFGQSVGLLLFAQDEASLWIPAEKALYTSQQAETLTEHLLGIPIPAELFIPSLAGVVPRKVLENLREQPVRSGWRIQDGDPSDSWTATWDFGVSPFELREIHVSGADQAVNVRYDPPVRLSAGAPPDGMVFSGAGWRLEVKVDRLERVQELQGEAFQVSYPSGLRRIDLDHEAWKARGL